VNDVAITWTNRTTAREGEYMLFIKGICTGNIMSHVYSVYIMPSQKGTFCLLLTVSSPPCAGETARWLVLIDTNVVIMSITENEPVCNLRDIIHRSHIITYMSLYPKVSGLSP